MTVSVQDVSALSGRCARRARDTLSSAPTAPEPPFLFRAGQQRAGDNRLNIGWPVRNETPENAASPAGRAGGWPPPRAVLRRGSQALH